jgi:hypothetical protein
MPVSLLHMSKLLAPGIWLWARESQVLSAISFDHFPHLSALQDYGVVRTFGDLRPLPRVFTSPLGIKYEVRTEFAGREYPQGWGRGPGGAAAEPLPEPDGKVDTFKEVRNVARQELDAEIEAFIEHCMKVL